METNTDQVPSQPTSRRPVFGIAALLLSLVPILIFITIAVVSRLYRYPLSVTLENTFGQFFYPNFILYMLCAGSIAAIAGTIAGIIGLIRKETRKGFAIAGLVLGILIGLVTVCSLGIAIMLWMDY